MITTVTAASVLLERMFEFTHTVFSSGFDFSFVKLKTVCVSLRIVETQWEELTMHSVFISLFFLHTCPSTSFPTCAFGLTPESLSKI